MTKYIIAFKSVRIKNKKSKIKGLLNVKRLLTVSEMTMEESPESPRPWARWTPPPGQGSSATTTTRVLAGGRDYIEMFTDHITLEGMTTTTTREKRDVPGPRNDEYNHQHGGDHNHHNGWDCQKEEERVSAGGRRRGVRNYGSG